MITPNIAANTMMQKINRTTCCNRGRSRNWSGKVLDTTLVLYSRHVNEGGWAVQNGGKRYAGAKGTTKATRVYGTCRLHGRRSCKSVPTTESTKAEGDTNELLKRWERDKEQARLWVYTWSMLVMLTTLWRLYLWMARALEHGVL